MKSWPHLLFLFWILLLPEYGCAQNYWKSPPLYDYGNALKRKFIITTPGYMGPNALPVPEVKKGLVEDNFYVTAGSEVHIGEGDFTRNAYAKIYYPVVPGKVAFEVYGLPYEVYTLTEQTKQERRILDVNSSGHTWGDYYFSTIIQLTKDKPVIPDLTLAFSCKTASGGSILNARFTDAPAYFFDLSFGKDLKIPITVVKRFRVYGTGGFYVWQTNSDHHPQDDAVLYGLGMETQLRKWRFNQVLAGYNGYLDMRDRPSVIRFQATRQQPLFSYGLEYQVGLRDYQFSSFKFLVTFFLLRNKIKPLKPE